MKEKLIIEYIINYLKYYENSMILEEDSIILYMVRIKIEELLNLNKEQLKILNENMKKQVEG